MKRAVKLQRASAPSVYSSLIEVIPDPIVLVLRDGIIADLNPAFTRMQGEDKSELIGRNISRVAALAELWAGVDIAMLTSEAVSRASFGGREHEVRILPVSGKDGEDIVCLMLRDMSSYVRLEKELLKRNRELIVTNTLSGTFISSDNMDRVLEDLLDKILLITEFHTGWLMVNRENGFRIRASRGLSGSFQEALANGSLDTLVDWISGGSEPIHLIERDRMGEYPLLKEEGISFLAAIPIQPGSHSSGILFLASSASRSMDFDFAALLSLVANSASHIIDKISLFQETRRLAITDGLTGLYNSRHFYKSLESEIARTKRYGEGFSLILFDIDNFKALNDTYGHQAGDEVLQRLAHILRAESRQTDMVARYGGEEFVIILPRTREDETLHLADRIRAAVAGSPIPISASDTVRISLSGGVASFPDNAESAKALLNAADSAMYAAKAAGKNTVQCFHGKIYEKGI